MSTKFNEWVAEVEGNAGPEGRVQLDTFRSHYTLANQLLVRRREMGLTQQQLAERSGIQQADISRIERGDGNPQLATMERLASALDAQFAIVPRHPAAT
jgi:DNA-binding XRE family transcriptional regulator